jgi:hypothetical protein
MELQILGADVIPQTSGENPDPTRSWKGRGQLGSFRSPLRKPGTNGCVKSSSLSSEFAVPGNIACSNMAGSTGTHLVSVIVTNSQTGLSEAQQLACVVPINGTSNVVVHE